MSWTPEVRCVLRRQGARKLNEGSAGKANARRAARQLMAMIPGGPVPRDRPEDVDLPPGQHWVSEFRRCRRPPPAVTKADWAFTVAAEDGRTRRWDWVAFRPAQPAHQRRPALRYRMVGTRVEVGSNLRAPRVVRGRDVGPVRGGALLCRPDHQLAPRRPGRMPAWLAFSRDGHELAAAEGGPAWLLVPHLYLWKSLPWVSGMTLTVNDKPGTWERRATTTTAIPGASNASKAINHDTDTTRLTRKRKTPMPLNLASRPGRLRLITVTAVLAIAGLLITSSQAPSARAAAARTAHVAVTAGATGTKPTIVLEHGAWADSSSWTVHAGSTPRLHRRRAAQSAAQPPRRLRLPS